MSEENGFLTDTDRQFLMGEKEYSGDNAKHLRYQRRRAIAERTRQAFYDFELLFDVLDEHERDRIFDPPRDERVDLHHAVRDTIAFLYWAIEREPGAQGDHRSFIYRFDHLFQAGLRRGEKRRHDRPAVVVYEPYNIDHRQYPSISLQQVADDLVENSGTGVADETLRHAIKQLTQYTTGERKVSDATIGGEPLDELASVTDLHDLADYVAAKAEEADEDTDLNNADE